MSHDPHFGFVVAAYVLALTVIGGMIAAITVDYRRLKRALELLGRHQSPPDKSSRGSGESQAPNRQGLE